MTIVFGVSDYSTYQTGDSKYSRGYSYHPVPDTEFSCIYIKVTNIVNVLL